MDYIDDMACAICWAGFQSEPESHQTKAARYWRKVTEPNKEYYRRLARAALRAFNKKHYEAASGPRPPRRVG